MLIVFQSPILDLRWLSQEHSVAYPTELPQTTGERTVFQHFGMASNRRCGASDTFPDEAFYYSAHNALRLPSFGKDQLRAAQVELHPRIYTNRRLYLSGDKLPVRVELEIGLAAMQKKLDFQSLNRLLTQVLRIPAKVPEFPTLAPAQGAAAANSEPAKKAPRKKVVQGSTLSDIGRPLAERFAWATTLRGRELSPEEMQLVKPAETSAMVVQFNRDEVDWGDISKSLPWFQRIDRKLMGNADIYAGSLTTPRGYQVPCWLISPGMADPEQVRNLRILLLRLHAEYSAAKQVLNWFFGDSRIISPLDPAKVREYLDGVHRAWFESTGPLAIERDALLDGLAILAHSRSGTTKDSFRYSLEKALKELPLEPKLPKAKTWPPTWLAQMEQKPDFVVGINFEEGSPELEWRLWAADPTLIVPVEPQITEIGLHPQDLAGLTGQPGDAFFAEEVLSSGRTLGSCMPPIFWKWLDKFTQSNLLRPSILLLTNEPYLPWERAIDCREGADQNFLGARAIIGRWPVAQNRMPPGSLVIRKAALFSGFYEEEGDIPAARTEAATIDANLSQVRPPAPEVKPVGITGKEVREHFQTTPDDSLIHFAMHANSAEGSLADGLRLGDKGYLGSGPIGLLKLQKGAPFVFVNACQGGAGKFLLGKLQGLPESFVAAGASAVVAPFWDIEDEKAHHLAVQFYQEVLLNETKAAETKAAEFFCDVRKQFGNPPGTPINLAYKFYGHPLLQLLLPKETQDGPNTPTP